MRKFICLWLALMAFALVSPAWAALDLSHHDMPNYLTTPANQDKCFYCHGIQDLNDATAIRTDYGTVGAFCLTRCHNAAGLIGAVGAVEPEAPASNGGAGDTWARPGADYAIVAWTSSHADNTTKAFYGASAANLVGTSGFPYATNANLQCTSCHSVHDAANAPFAWATLGGSAAGTNLCERCHGLRATNTLSANPDGNHPVNFVYDETAALGRSGATASGVPRNGRTISIDWTGNVFDVPVPGTLSTSAQNYATGGHLSGLATKATSGQTMGCFTCHSAHQPGTAANNLTVVTMNDSGLTFSALCMGCHGSASTWATNATDNSVGANGPEYYGHPYGAGSGYNSLASGVATYPVSVGGFTFTLPYTTVENANTQNGIQFGTGGTLLCTTCHDVHLGWANSKALADLGQNAGSNICNACHNGSEFLDVTDVGEAGTGEAANSHHRTTLQPTAIAADHNPANDAQNLSINLSWMTPVYYNQGSLADGLQCADCHQFNGTAHNWP